MEEQLIEFETAKLAKEKGFDWLVSKHYKEDRKPAHEILGASKNKENNIVSAPRQAFLQKWLREEHGLYVLPRIEKHNGLYYIECFIWIDKKASYLDSDIVKLNYEEALEKGLIEGLKLIENK